MTAFDTNVIVRLLVQDDEDQCRRAEAVFRGAIAADSAWLFEEGSADFADYVILESSREAAGLPLHTFDERLARAPGAELVP